MKIRPKMLEALRNDAEAAADAIDEAQQQLNVLYESIRDAHAGGCCTVEELEQTTGLGSAAVQIVVAGANPPIQPAIDLP
jgi:ribosome-binding factor A